MKIEEMGRRHLAGIAAVEKACFAHPWSEQALNEEISRGIFLVACEDDRVCGYVGCQTVLDEGYITNVAVLPAFRRRGVAQALLDTLWKRAESLSFVTLEVRQGNTAAIALYAKLGFTPVGTRKGFYADPAEDAVLMTKYRKDDSTNER